MNFTDIITKRNESLKMWAMFKGDNFEGIELEILEEMLEREDATEQAEIEEVLEQMEEMKEEGQLQLIEEIQSNYHLGQAIEIVTNSLYMIHQNKDFLVDWFIEVNQVPEAVISYLDEEQIIHDLLLDGEYIERNNGELIEIQY